MLVYTADKRQFVEHVNRNEIDERILDRMMSQGLGRVGRAEVASWRTSMQYMKNILATGDIPDDAGVAIEYTIPQTSKRIDFILTGRNPGNIDTAVIVELKQWETASLTPKDAVVETFLGGGQREVTHPSYQAWTYAALLEDFNEAVETGDIKLRPCAYLHNCVSYDTLHADFYAEHLDKAPAFLKHDADKLRRFIQQHVRKGDQNQIIYRIENGRIRPSKSLTEHLSSLLEGNQEFLMVDDQKLVYESGLQLADIADQAGKQVFVVEGGPGTGKSVVAINLLVELLRRGRVANYVTRNAAPRQVYKSKLTGTMKRTRIDNLFRGSGGFHSAEPDSFDVLVVDEAHRLNEKSGLYQNLGENQIKEIINAAHTSIFFLDEDQRVTWKDIGSRKEIEHRALEAGATIHYAELRSQFRCNGSDGYLAWLDNALQIRETANLDLKDLDYRFEVVDSPAELRDRIFALNVEANRARLLAGYCWDWISKKKDPKAFDITFPEHGFAMKWNLDKDGPLWLIQPNSVQEIGCIHTCQGLELDYVGVIIGSDLVVRDGCIVTNPRARSRMDSSIKGYVGASKQAPETANRKAETIIKNTYRTLLSRGMKGCFVWCTDEETQQYFKDLAGKSMQDQADTVQDTLNDIPFPVIPAEEAHAEPNAVPVFDIKAAAGSFSDFQYQDERRWVRLPDHIKALPDMFVAQVVGESMNRCIPNGAWGLFRWNPAGTRQGKIVLVQHRDITDPDTGATATVKRYYSDKQADPETEWRHSRIILKPDSTDPHYEPILLEEDPTNRLTAAELVAIIHQL